MKSDECKFSEECYNIVKKRGGVIRCNDPTQQETEINCFQPKELVQ